MNQQRNIPWITIALGVVFLGCLLFVMSTSGGNTVYVDGTKVNLDNAHAGADETGGFTQTSVTNYSFLVDTYGGYSYADAIQSYLTAYLRIAHDEAYSKLTIDTDSFKHVNSTASTFTATYGDNRKLEVRIVADPAIATLNVTVTRDNSQSAGFTTGDQTIDVLN